MNELPQYKELYNEAIKKYKHLPKLSDRLQYGWWGLCAKCSIQTAVKYRLHYRYMSYPHYYCKDCILDYKRSGVNVFRYEFT